MTVVDGDDGALIASIVNEEIQKILNDEFGRNDLVVVTANPLSVISGVEKFHADVVVSPKSSKPRPAYGFSRNRSFGFKDNPLVFLAEIDGVTVEINKRLIDEAPEISKGLANFVYYWNNSQLAPTLCFSSNTLKHKSNIF